MAFIHLNQGVLYKKFVNTLAVFICATSLEFFQTLDDTTRMPFHRYFILPDDSIKNATGITIKPTDSFMYMKITETDYSMIQRLVVAYSNPMYEKIIIFKSNKEINFFNISSLFQESNYFDNDEYIGFTRRSFVLDGTKTKAKENIQNEVFNDYDFMENIGTALDGVPVSPNIFLKARSTLGFNMANSEMSFKQTTPVVSETSLESKTRIFWVGVSKTLLFFTLFSRPIIPSSLLLQGALPYQGTLSWPITINACAPP